MGHSPEGIPDGWRRQRKVRWTNGQMDNSFDGALVEIVSTTPSNRLERGPSSEDPANPSTPAEAAQISSTSRSAAQSTDNAEQG